MERRGTDARALFSQSGYNLCNSTTVGPNSQCQTAITNNISDFCLWGSPTPDGSIGDIEAAVVAYCTTDKHGTRVIPPGAITGLQVRACFRDPTASPCAFFFVSREPTTATCGNAVRAPKPSLPPSTPRGGCLFVLLICVSPIDSTGHAHLGVHPVDRSHRHDGARTPSQRHGWRARPSRVRRVVSLLTFHQRRLPFVLLYLSLCSADLLGNPLGGLSLPPPVLDSSGRTLPLLTPSTPQVWSSLRLFLAETTLLCSKSSSGTTLLVPVGPFCLTAFRTHHRFRCRRRPFCHSDKLAYAPRCICRRVLLEELLRFFSGTCLP